MFDVGRAKLRDYTVAILHELGPYHGESAFADGGAAQDLVSGVLRMRCRARALREGKSLQKPRVA